VPPPERYPRLGVWLAPQQAGRPEAQALAAELTARLRASGSLRLGGADAPATHAAVIAVDRIAVTDRLHHVHRYRQGLLTASIVVTDTRTGVVVLRRRDDADLTERSDRIDNQRMVAALVSDVASRWLVVLEDPSLVQLMTGKGEP